MKTHATAAALAAAPKNAMPTALFSVGLGPVPLLTTEIDEPKPTGPLLTCQVKLPR